jgi:rod shape-determining protein MreD
MSVARSATRWQLAFAIGLLLVLQFYVRPRLFDGRYAPDFALIGLVLLAIRFGAGAGAAIGFLVGLAGDAMTPARFGASALAHTVVGYLAAWSRAFFFADNLAVIAGFLAVAAWIRDLVVLLASGSSDGGLIPALFIDAPLRALATAISGSLLLLLFRSWFGIRLDQ